MKRCAWTKSPCYLDALSGAYCYYHDKVARGLFKDRKRRRLRRRGPALDGNEQAVLEVLREGAA